MARYPIHFHNTIHAPAGSGTSWTSSSESFPQTVELAVPPAFGGPGGAASPEDLYALALANCFVATFKVLADLAKLAFANLEARTTLSIDRGEGGFPWMKHLKVAVSVQGASDVEALTRLLNSTTQQCMIIKSTKTEVEFEFAVS